MVNEVMIANSSDTNDLWEDITDVSNAVGTMGLGWYYSLVLSASKKARCAIRFPSVNISKGINYAALYYWTQHNTRGGPFPPSTGTWDFTIKGIDEDNTASFSSNPFSRPQTSGSNSSSNADEPSLGTWKEIEVTNAVNAVMNRSGWNTGNAIGLLLEPINSGSGKYAGTSTEFKAFLVIRKDSSPNLTPTPKSVVAPTFPPAGNWGMAWAYPGRDVFEAGEGELYQTTRKRVHRIIFEGVTTTVANVEKLIAHGLPFTPYATVYAKSLVNGQRFKLPRHMPTAVQQAPEGDTLEGTVSADDTYVRILTTSDAEVYYRIFIDELSI